MRRAWPVLVAILCAAAPAAPAPHAKAVSFAILEDYDKGEDLRDIERDFALFEELDIRTWRGSFGWDDYEPNSAQFDFAWLRQFVALAERRRLQLRPYLAYTPEWAAARGSDGEAWNDAPRWLAEWRRFAASIAGALEPHPNVVSFEIYNEQNVKQWWDATPSRYADVMTSGSRAIRDANGRVQILFGGLVFPDAPWVEDVCSAPGARSFDVLPFHAYPETWTPAGVTVENYLDGLDGFLAVADESCGRKAIWINETGFATTTGKTEHEQAAWWVRAVATFLAHPRVEHIGVYEIKDLSPDKPAIGDAPNYHLGLTRTDRTKKLAFYTVDMLTDLLDTGMLRVADDDLDVELLSGSGPVHAHLFVRPDGNRVLVAWTKTAPARARFDGGRASRIIEYALDGSPAAVEGLQDIELLPGLPRVFLLRG